MMQFLTTITAPFYLLFGSWNFFTMIIVGITVFAILGVFINIIYFKR